MKELSILKQMKQTLQSLLCRPDGRVKDHPLRICDEPDVELSARQQAGLTGESAAYDEGTSVADNQPQAFWERLSRQCLNTFLLKTVSALMSHLYQGVDCRQQQFRSLGVCGIELIDSTSFHLHDSVAGTFPGTFNVAGIKWHACFNLLSGALDLVRVFPLQFS